MQNEATTNLPPHLAKLVNDYESKCAEFGINPNWHVEALALAEQRGDDFNPIHGLIA